MKKGLLFLPLLASFALAGCDLFGGGDDAWIVKPEISGGTKAEKNAILTAVNNLSVCTTKAGADLFPTAKSIRLKEDEQDYIRILNKVKVDDLTVNLTWNIDKKQSTYDTVVSPDKGVTNFIYIKYPGYTGSDSTFKWSISKITCGGAVSTKTNCDYKASVIKGTHPWVPMTMEHILEVGDQGSDYSYTVGSTEHKFESICANLIDYESKDSSGKYSPWWNAEAVGEEGDEKYHFVEVKGKVTFLSEDGNWGLFQNGNHVLELYSGDQLDLNVESYPELANKYVAIKAEVGHGYGNFQLSFIKSIRAIKASEVTEPSTSFKNITETELAQAARRGGGAVKKNYKQFTSAFEHNQLVSLTGKVTTLKANDGSSGRFLIGVTPTGSTHEIFIAYDYHTDRESQAVKNKLLQKYETVKNKTTEFTIKGTLRFSHAQQKVLVPADGSGGTWDIVPFDVSHII